MRRKLQKLQDKERKERATKKSGNSTREVVKSNTIRTGITLKPHNNI